MGVLADRQASGKVFRLSLLFEPLGAGTTGTIGKMPVRNHEKSECSIHQ
jgi:hypothetical protein